MKKIVHFLCFMCVSLMSLDALQAQAPLNAIDLGIFNAPVGSNKLAIRLKPTTNINLPYTGGRFTVRYPTTSGVTLTIPPDVPGSAYNPFGYGKTNIGGLLETPFTDGYTYVVFNYVAGGSVNAGNWPAGVAVIPPILTIQINGLGSNALTFELITGNAWTNANNGNYYQELDSDSEIGSQNGFYQASTDVVLPVELLSFQAEKKGKTSLITWESIREQNLSMYGIERSSDGVNFKNIGYQKPKASNVSERIAYEFIDEAPAIGINYYRLQSKDMDNTAVYSKIASIDFGSGLKVKTYPNPFVQDLNIEMDVEQNINGDVLIDLFDMTGKQVLNQKVAGQGRTLKYSLPADDLASGSYLIRVQTNGYTWQQKITKQ